MEILIEGPLLSLGERVRQLVGYRNSERTRRIYTQHYGQIPKGMIIHHIDGNPANDAIENLMCLDHSLHRRLHLK